MANVFNYIELKYEDLSNQISEWLSGTYHKAGINLNSVSPYGQIINVVKEIFQHLILYLKSTLKVLDIETTQNRKVALQTARIAGHNPGRSISATGTLKFTLKQGIEIDKKIKGSTITINNRTVIKNKTNSLKYTTLGGKQNIRITDNRVFYISIIQGVYETQKFTGTGLKNQSFSVNIPGYKEIENFNYIIKYNSNNVRVKDHLYDILPMEKSCFIRTGFNGGIDIYFGNVNFGFVPHKGSTIEVQYLLSDGADGEILNPITNDWKFEDDLIDGEGNSLNVDDLFNIEIETNINFGADGESLAFTKSAIPHVSRNFVLGTPEQFTYHLLKLNMFSKVYVYNKLSDNNYSIDDNVIENSLKKLTENIKNNVNDDVLLNNIDTLNNIVSKYKTNLNDNEIYLFLIPDITKYFNQDINYFNIPFDAFYLDNDEQSKIKRYLRQLGTLAITTNLKIVQPTISKYIIHVFIRSFGNNENIKQEVIDKLSDYFLTNTRNDRIPKSDLITIIKNINGVDSTSVYFVSEKNEKYHKKGIDLGIIKENKSIPKYNTKSKEWIYEPTKMKSSLSDGTRTIKNKTYYKKSYNPVSLLGIDSIHGDIIIEEGEYVVIRGGWKDRNGIYYNENPLENGILNSINIVFN